jgi:hypothetical protein
MPTANCPTTLMESGSVRGVVGWPVADVLGGSEDGTVGSCTAAVGTCPPTVGRHGIETLDESMKIQISSIVNS